MRLMRHPWGLVIAGFGIFLLALAGAQYIAPLQAANGSGRVRALLPQNPDTMLPEQSAAKARELIAAAIQALGGDAYLKVRDITRTGRLAQFSSQGELAGYIGFVDYYKLPDKNRTEYSKKRNIIDVFNGDKGWSLDREGVQETPVAGTARFQEGLMKDVDHFFRYRLGKEEGLSLRYGGSDILELKQVDWIVVQDSERRVMRIALDRSTRLPARAVYVTRDPETRNRMEETELFANYHSFQGIMTPKQITRERNGRPVYQAFFESVRYNSGLDDFFFTRESLEQAWAKLGKKK